MSRIKQTDLSEYSPERIVRDLASLRGKVPFTAAQCFEAVKDIDEQKAVSDALVRLYRKGLVARRKDGVRFEYVWHTFAGQNFEMYADAPAKGETLIFPETSQQGVADSSPRTPAAAEIPIPESIRKRPEKPEQPQSFSAEVIAEALIRKLKPMLQAEFANAALESSDALAEPCSRVTIRIEKLEITVGGMLP